MLKVSVSGVRGIVGESLTREVAMEFGMAFGALIKGGKVVIGRDTRTTGEMLQDAVTYGLLSSGCKVVDIGISPTPTVLLMSRRMKANGLIITASHNPSEWNGIKFAKKDGTFLGRVEMAKLFDIYKRKEFNIATCRRAMAPKTVRFNKAIDIHIGTVLKNINKDLIKKRKFRVACDFCNGTGAVITRKFLEKLGCRVYAINDRPDGRFAHNPEPVRGNLKSLAKFVRAKKTDIGLAQDPDADRLALSDEKGTLIGEENTLTLAVKAVLSKRKGKVVVNVSTSMAIDMITGEFGVKLFRTPVGEINVVEKIKKTGAIIGGEGNGGVIYPKINLCRDSLVGIGIILEYMAETGKTLSSLVNGIAQYNMVKGKFHYPQDKTEAAIRKIKAEFRNGELDLTDGVKIIWPGGWVHARPSNTEPIMRIIAEAKTVKEAKRLYNLVKGVVLKK